MVAAVIARRCWGDGDPLFERYHDEEWGLPVLDERGLFEKLCLEAFQAGMSWRTVLTKRDAFRVAFENFDPDAVARFGDDELQRLLGDSNIIRNRAKIEATFANARATVALRPTGEPLDAVIRAHAPAPQDPPPATWADVPSTRRNPPPRPASAYTGTPAAERASTSRYTVRTDTSSSSASSGAVR